MSLVGEAAFHAFMPEKLNYELLGNGDAHLHWHIFPRVSGDTPNKGPVWLLPHDKMYSDNNQPSNKELEIMKNSLGIELEKLLHNQS